MNRSRLNRICCQMMVVVSLWICAVPVVGAADCSRPTVSTSEQASGELDRLRGELCLGDRACTTILCQQIGELENRWGGKETAPELFSEAAGLFRQIRASATKLPEQGAGVPQLTGMLVRWNDALAGVSKANDSGSISRSTTDEWKPKGLKLFSGTTYQIDFDATFADLCSAPAPCQEAFDSATDSFSHTVMVHRVLSVLIGSDMRRLGSYLDTLDKRWQAYHNETRAIFPWELMVNGYFYKSRQAGFGEPPTSQILLLHPSAGLEYRDDTNDKLKPAILLDVIGFYHWKWGGSSNAEVSWPYGLALAMAWDGEDFSYGITLHLPRNWSLGVTTDFDGHVMAIFSVDLGNFLMNKQKSVSELRQQFLQFR